jgi:hypothetical protein
VPMVWRSDRKLAGHFEQLIVQRADKLGGLWGIASIHTGGVAQLALSQTAKWLERSRSTQHNENTWSPFTDEWQTRGKGGQKAFRVTSVSHLGLDAREYWRTS